MITLFLIISNQLSYFTFSLLIKVKLKIEIKREEKKHKDKQIDKQIQFFNCIHIFLGCQAFGLL